MRIWIGEMCKSIEKIEDYREKIELLTQDLDDNFLLGYSEAILNLLGKFTSGQCEDCPFSYEVEYYNSDFVYPEYDTMCKLEKCWIDAVKDKYHAHNPRYNK